MMAIKRTNGFVLRNRSPQRKNNSLNQESDHMEHQKDHTRKKRQRMTWSKVITIIWCLFLFDFTFVFLNIHKKSPPRHAKLFVCWPLNSNFIDLAPIFARRGQIIALHSPKYSLSIFNPGLFTAIMPLVSMYVCGQYQYSNRMIQFHFFGC